MIKYMKEKLLTHEDFKTSLFEKKRFMDTGTKIVQDKHSLFTAGVTEMSLAPFNDNEILKFCWIKVQFLIF